MSLLYDHYHISLLFCLIFIMYFVFSILFLVFFFFKQKTAYEMRISDWSSDVCSSDLSPGTLTINGDLTLNGASILDLEFGQANVVGGPLNDLIDVDRKSTRLNSSH